jgi:hypothetical protein
VNLREEAIEENPLPDIKVPFKSILIWEEKISSDFPQISDIMLVTMMMMYESTIQR